MEAMLGIVMEHAERVHKRKMVMRRKKIYRYESDPDNIGNRIFFQHYR